MKIYTKTGDTGSTGLYGGLRVSKDCPRIEAYGTVDELNAAIGMARSFGLPTGIDTLLQRIQNELFDLGAELATPDPQSAGIPMMDAQNIHFLEAAIDRYEAGLPSLKEFILPVGASGATSVHFARTVCRRTERLVITLVGNPEEKVSWDAIIYLNRLSDLLFVLARAINHAAGRGDEPWQKQEERR